MESEGLEAGGGVEQDIAEGVVVHALGDNARGELLRYDHFSINVDMQPGGIDGYLGVGFQGDGFIDAKVRTGWEPRREIIHCVYASRRGQLPAVRALIDFLVEEFARLQED